MGPNGLPTQAGAVDALLRGPAEITLGTMVAKDGGIDKSRAGTWHGPGLADTAAG